MDLTEEFKQAYFSAVFNSQFGFNNEPLKRLKEEYPSEYYFINSFYHMRSNMNKDIEIMQLVGTVQWFTLTFDNKRDKNKITSKRKSATRFCNDLFSVYFIVEEYGDDNDRYHIHGFGVYRDGKGFEDFRKWPCRSKIEYLSDSRLKKKVRYLTKYATKQLPRKRRSKSLVKLAKANQGCNCLKRRFNSSYEDIMNIAIEEIKNYNVSATNITPK